MVKKAVCMISGGLDSCITSFIAKEDGYEIYAISFNYGQLHEKELFYANKISKAVGAKHHLILDIDFEKFTNSSLLSSSSQSIQDHSVNDIGKGIPSTYVPARNTVFLSLAF